MEKDKKKQIAKISVFITSIFVVFMSVTYAFITEVLIGTKQVVINAGILNLVLEEDNAITISDVLPMYDEVGMIQDDSFNFRLVNKTSNKVDYKLKLSKVSTENELNLNQVKYYLTKDGGGAPKLLSTIPSDEIVDNGTIAGNKTINYTLRLWIDSSVTNDNDINGKSLSYKINVDVAQEIKKGTVLVGGIELPIDRTINPDFSKISSATNGRGIYEYTEDGEDIYYWRGKVDESNVPNHVMFAGMCWEMIRTTKTGGVKMIYDGMPVDGKCSNTGVNSQLPQTSAFNSKYNSPDYVGYMYANKVYESKSKSKTDSIITTSGIKYGNDVEWDGINYKIVPKVGGSLFSSTGVWDSDRNSIGNGNHYTCFNSSGTCETIYYVFYTGINNWGTNTSSNAYYIELTNGVKIENVLTEMHKNEQPSTMKTTIENWFETTDLVKSENLGKLEDPVFCNDRSVEDGKYGGWLKDGNANSPMYYGARTRAERKTPDLSCRNNYGNRDRFTYKDTIDGNGLLKYPVGLITADEIMLAGGVLFTENQDYYLRTRDWYWAFSPRYFYGDALGFRVDDSGSLGDHSVTRVGGVRPVISLVAGTTFSRGIGTEVDPYVVE